MGNESSGCFVAEPLAELDKAGVRSSVYAVDPFYRPRAHTIPSAPDLSWVRYPAIPGGLGLSSAGVGLFVRLRTRVQELHARFPVDVIHAHGALPCGHAAALLSRRLKIPFVVTVHGLDAYSVGQVSGWPGATCMRTSKEVYAAARRVIGVSRHVCDEVEKGMGGLSTTSVVYNGVDPELFVQGEDPAQPVLLTVGNLIPIKGHELIVRALKALLPKFPALTWEVIGDGPERDRIRVLAEELGVGNKIRFRGRQNRRQVAEAFRRCTAFVLPSRYEGLGCVYLEAMACGKVSVGCEGQGIEEVIRHGENGWLVPPNGREQLIEGLNRLLGDEPRRHGIGAAARQTILQSFTLAHQATGLRTIFELCREEYRA